MCDKRDTRGKRHELAFILVLIMIALLRTDKKVTVAYMHRIMQNECADLYEKLEQQIGNCVSYSQLKRVLKSVDYERFNEINQAHWAHSTENEGPLWYALDGKELRGSIDTVSGEKRGQALVSRTEHRGSSRVLGFYDGSKESEKPEMSAYFESFERLNGKYTLDALHLSESLSEQIHQKGGTYLMQVKGNQKHLLDDCEHTDTHLKADYEQKTAEKGHGRCETRIGSAYRLNKESLDARWSESGMQTLVVLDRERVINKTGKTSQEKSYWVSNMALNEDSFPELVGAVRRHWQIEVHHNFRDTQIGEDAMICRDKNESRFFACCITVITNLLDAQKSGNRTQLRELFSQRRKEVDPLFKPNSFL